MKDNNAEKKSVFEILSFTVAGIACLGGFASVIVPLAMDKKIPVESLYWFSFALIAVIFPYIREFTFKDLKVVVNDMKTAKTNLENAVTSLEKAQNKIDATRVELIKGYQKYLAGLPEDKRMKKIKLLSGLYLNDMNLTIREVKTMLHEVNFYKGKIDDEFTKDYFNTLWHFQEKTGLKPDGIFGYQSYRNLMKMRIEKGS